MKKIYLRSVAIFLMTSLSSCDEGSKDNTTLETAKSLVSNVASVSDVPDLKVVKWGPFQTPVGRAFNEQPNGESAFWFQMAGQIKPGAKLQLWFGDTKLEDVVLNSELGAGAILPSPLLDKAGDYPLYLIDASSKKRFDIGVFKILPDPLAVTSPEINTTTKKISKPKVTK